MRNRGKQKFLSRIQFFQHYPHSTLPIRDIRHHSEPHIEIGAHGYTDASAQKNLRVFCQSGEQYLFLGTTCRNRELARGKYFNRRFIVGVIHRARCISLKRACFVIGAVRIVPFSAQLTYEALGWSRKRNGFRLDQEQTRRLFRRLGRLPEIRDKCVQEMMQLETRARECGEPVAIETACKDRNGQCAFRTSCRRRKLTTSPTARTR